MKEDELVRRVSDLLSEAEELRSRAADKIAGAEELIRSVANVARTEPIADLASPTHWERATHEGRQIHINKSRDPGPVGPIEAHCMVVRDPNSWAQSSLADWYREYILERVRTSND